MHGVCVLYSRFGKTAVNSLADDIKLLVHQKRLWLRFFREKKKRERGKKPGLFRNGPVVKGRAGLRYFNSSVVCMGSKVTLSMVYAFN